MTIKTAIKKIQKDSNEVLVWVEALDLFVPVTKKWAVASLKQTKADTRSYLRWERGTFTIG